MIPALALLCLVFQDVSVDALVEKLRTEDAVERRKIQLELLRRGPSALPALVKALEGASPRPDADVLKIVRRLTSPSWKERNEATEALAGLGRPVVALLEAQVASADPEAAWRLRSAIAEIRERAGRDDLLEEYRASTLCEVLAQSGDARAVPPLLRLLTSPPADQRLELKRRAAEALGHLRPAMSAAQAEEVADPVVQVLERTPGPLEKGMLLKTLGRLGSPDSVRPIAALLADRSEKNVHLKRSCIAALAAIGNPRGIRAIAEALASDEVYLRQGAAAALEELSGGPFGFDPRATAEQNREALEKIRAWGASKYGKGWE